MFDTVMFEGALPKGVIAPDDNFQTKSLFRMMDIFTITPTGRLIQHKRRYLDVARPSGDFIKVTPTHEPGEDMNFHGDIALSGFKGEEHAAYVVRFTHGTLEWIRPIEALSEHEKALALRANLED